MYSRRVAACGSFIAAAQVGNVMQPRGAITDLGEIRRKDHASGLFICTPHADSVDPGVAGERLFAAGACKMKITEIKSRDPIAKVC